MKTQTTDTAVRVSISVDAPIDKAFSVFTEEMGSWWPAEHHLGPVEEMVFEPRSGGRIIDRLKDGSECPWARVFVYEPPQRLVFSWDISLQWQIESDPGKTSEVEVRFVAEGPSTTRVELEHRYLDRHGDGWEQMRDAVSSEGGWPLGLDRFRDRVAA